MDKIWLGIGGISLIGILVLLVKKKSLPVRLKAWLNLIFFLPLVALNYATASGAISGFSQKDISRQYQTLITPAGFTFSIWGVIYVLLLACIIHLIWKSQDAGIQEVIEKISPYLWPLFFFNILWNLVFAYGLIGFSALAIIGYWISLLLICLYLKPSFNLLSVSFGLHIGWITVATIVNIIAFLVKIRWQALEEDGQIWYLVFLLIGIGAGFTVQWISSNTGVALALAWAYFGIFYRLQQVGDWLLRMTCVIGILFFLFMMVFGFGRRLKPALNKRK